MKYQGVIALVGSVLMTQVITAVPQIHAATVTNASVPCRGNGTTSVSAAPGETFTLEFTDPISGTSGMCDDTALDWDTSHFSSVTITRRVKINPAAGTTSPYRVTFTLSTSIPIGTVTNIRLWDGVPFGNAIPVTVVPPGTPPPPWWQSIGRGTDAHCPLGWGASWAEWAQPVTGGWVCNRVVFWDGARWMQAMDLDDSRDAAIWDGK